MIRIGLLGASRISRGAVIKPAAGTDAVEVTAVAARDRVRAAEFAEEHGIRHVEPDYDALIASEHIDVLYNGLPPAGHAKWSIAALEAGKHVLCEKPFAMNAIEAQEMVDAAERTGQCLIEAFHYRFHPAFIRTLELLDGGAIGAIRHIEGRFNIPIAFTPGEIRYRTALGGGALMDLGCYPVHWARSVARAEPEVVAASAIQHESGVDVAMDAELEFASGVSASVHCSMSEDLPEGLDVELGITGEAGALTMTNPLVPHIGNEIVVENAAGTLREEMTGNSTYFYQLQHVLQVLGGETEAVTGGADAVANMRVLDEVYRVAGFQARF